MKRCSTVQLREKEIINLCDGMRLGYADDFEFDLNDGRITALLLTVHQGFLRCGKNDEFRIPWDKIECVGEDTVLVRLNPSEAPYCEFFRKNDRRIKLL
ncbi:MAG: YlmC/YmxH family sporulation protein [Clostridia bacterium]|nr:YlmC/YmxH family sporulation protein [Clostridia bacterium]